MDIREKIRVVAEGNLEELNTVSDSPSVTGAGTGLNQSQRERLAMARKMAPYVVLLKNSIKSQLSEIFKKLRKQYPTEDDFDLGRMMKKIMNGVNFYRLQESFFEDNGLTNPSDVGVYERESDKGEGESIHEGNIRKYRKTFEANTDSKYKVMIHAPTGEVLHKSKNLRGNLTYSRKHDIANIIVKKNSLDGSAKVRFIWDTGAKSEVEFSSFAVAKKWAKRPLFSAGKVVVKEGDKVPGSRDGTGPADSSYRKSRFKTGKRKANGEKCPARFKA